VTEQNENPVSRYRAVRDEIRRQTARLPKVDANGRPIEDPEAAQIERTRALREATANFLDPNTTA
jgi:hypothetical protein